MRFFATQLPRVLPQPRPSQVPLPHSLPEAQHARKNAVKQWDAPFPDWDERVDRALRERFGLHEFRPGHSGDVLPALPRSAEA